MPLFRLGDLTPTLAPGAWAAPSADLIGDVSLAKRSSVWFGATVPRRQHAHPHRRGKQPPGRLCLSFRHGLPIDRWRQGHGRPPGNPPWLHNRRRLPDRNGCAHSQRSSDRALLHCRRRSSGHRRQAFFQRRASIIGAPARLVRQLTAEERNMLKASAAHYADKAADYAARLAALS